MAKLKRKLKKMITLPNIIVLGVALFFLFNYTDKLAINETTALIFSQNTQDVDGACVYNDGLGTCVVPENHCLGNEITAVSLGLCDTVQTRAAGIGRTAQGAGTITFEGGVPTFKVSPGEHLNIKGIVKVTGDGTYLVEAGLEEYEKWKNLDRLSDAGRQALIDLGPFDESICDGVKFFASGIVKNAHAGDFIDFDLKPKAPRTEGTYQYTVYVANGCYKFFPGGKGFAMYSTSDPLTVIVEKGAGSGVPAEIDGDEKASVDSVWDDIKEDFDWAGGVKDAFKAKYILYGVMAIGAIILIMLMVSLPGGKGGRPAPPQQGQFPQRQVQRF